MHDIKAIRDDRDSWVKALSRRPAYAEIASHLADDILGKDKELRELYTNDVPVILVGAKEFGRHHVDTVKFRLALEKAKK